MKKSFIFAFAALIAVVAAACKNDPKGGDEEGGDGSLVQFKTMTFDDNGWETKKNAIHIEGDWSVESAPEWLTVERQSSVIAVNAHEYSHFRDRKGTIVIKSANETAEIEVTQTKNNPRMEILPVPGLPARAVSPNGRYVIGTHSAVSFAYDRMTEEAFTFGNGKGAANPPALTAGTVVINAVSDNGIVVGTASINRNDPDDPEAVMTLPFSFDLHSKNFTWLPLDGPEVEAVSDKTPTTSIAWDISADGTVISGYIGLPANSNSTGAELRYLPVVWKDGAIVVLEHNQKGLGAGIDSFGQQPRYMSADGKVIAGYVVTTTARYVGVYWNVDQPATANYILRDNPSYFATETTPGGETIPGKYFRANRLSDDGKIVTGSVEDFTGGGPRVSSPMNYNIETGAVVFPAGGNGLDGQFTLPDGTIVCLTGSMATMFFEPDGTLLDLQAWAQKNDIEMDTWNYQLRDASTSGKVMVGAPQSGSNQPIVIVR